MQILTKSRFFAISSKDANQYNNGTMLSDMVFIIPTLMTTDEVAIATSFSVVKIQIPTSVCNITATRNTLKMIINGTPTTFTFPTGAYNAYTFMSMFRTLTGMNISFEKHTYRFTISALTHGSIEFSISPTSTIASLIGIGPASLISHGYANTSPYAAIPNTLTLPSLFDFRRQQINVRSGALMLFNYLHSDKSQDVIHTFACDEILYEATTEIEFVVGQPNLEILDIRMTQNGEPVDFQGVHWNLQIKIEVTYKYEDLTPSPGLNSAIDRETIALLANTAAAKLNREEAAETKKRRVGDSDTN